MRLLDWLTGHTDEPSTELVKLDKLEEQVTGYAEGLRQEQETNLLLSEQISELESALTENGWDTLAASEPGTEFSRSGLQQISSLCRLTAIANPLVKRGVSLRVCYVWGMGVSVEGRAKGKEDGEQDVNAVVQTFWDDPSNQASWTGSQAREERERSVATDGNVFVACFTSRLTGRVQLRTLPFDQIQDVITNPEDRDEPWYYKREWVAEEFNAAGTIERRRKVAYYPALGIASGEPAAFNRRLRGKRREITDARQDTGPVYWDAPVLHVRVNALDGWKFGLPDVYAVLPWSRAYKDFLSDWARLVKALSRYAYRTSSKGSKVAKIAARVGTAAATNSRTGQPNDIGATAVTDEFTQLEAVPKTGATIDSESGRPLAAMVAAGLGVPVTMLLGDPGTTGARATAETLDRPTELEMNLRRELWSEIDQRLIDYAIDQAIMAKQLKGTRKIDQDGREQWVLTGDEDGSMRTVDISWPPLDDVPVDVLVKSITLADQTEKMPPKLTFRLLATALGVEDVDELIEELTDDDGNWIPLDIPDQQVRGRMADRGEDGTPVSVPDDQQEPEPAEAQR